MVPQKAAPGSSTLAISATASLGLGQQWIAAPACTAPTLSLVIGILAMSARTNTRSSDWSTSPSSLANVLACRSIASLKSNATTQP